MCCFRGSFDIIQCIACSHFTFHSTHYLYAGDGRGNNINVILTVAQARVFTISVVVIAIVIISSLFRLPGFILSRIILFWGALFVADQVNSSGHHHYVVTNNYHYNLCTDHTIESSKQLFTSCTIAVVSGPHIIVVLLVL